MDGEAPIETIQNKLGRMELGLRNLGIYAHCDPERTASFTIDGSLMQTECIDPLIEYLNYCKEILQK